MSIAPAWLQGVTSYKVKSIEVKTLRRVGHGRSRDVAENIRFAAAGCTRTGAAKEFEVQV